MSVPAENLFPAGFDSGATISGVPWLDRRRADALQRFRAGGIPHRRIEEWKYSDLRNALDSPRISTRQHRSEDFFADISSKRMLISDGRVSPPDSANAPPGVEILDLANVRDDAPEWVKADLGRVLKGGSMGQASLALMEGGVALRISGDVTTPLHLRFEQQADAVHGRVLVVLDEGSSLLLLESHAPSDGLTDVGVEFVLAPHARLTHVRLADTASDAIHIEEIGVRAERGAKYRAHFSQTGAKLARLELAIVLAQEGAAAEMSGGAALVGKRHSDITTHVIHDAGKTESRQLFKYAVADHARAIYQGRITVAKGADGSDSRQTAKAILLGERAEADLKPELEILADDVKCAHGAAVGDLDGDSLFYLRSRGVPEAEARGLLLRAFLEETMMNIMPDEVRAAVWRFIDRDLLHITEAAR